MKIIERIPIRIRKYFTIVDTFTFGVGLTSLVIMYFAYSTEPKDSLRNMVYTVSASIVAASIFYLITIFIPNCYQIYKVNDKIGLFGNTLDFCTNKLLKIIFIENESCLCDYDLIKDFANGLIKKEDSRISNTITSFYEKLENKLYLETLISCIKATQRYCNSSYSCYSKYLPDDIQFDLINFFQHDLESTTQMPASLNKDIFLSLVTTCIKISTKINNIYGNHLNYKA